MKTLPIILIHGFPFDGSMWQAQTDGLASAAGGGLTVLAPDLPGFGAALEPPPEQPSMEGYARAIHAVVQEHGGRCIVGGLSMGGYVLLELLRSFPGDVAGAMLIDTRAEADTVEGRGNRLKSIADIRGAGAGPGSTARLIQGMAPRLLAKTASAAVQQKMRAMMSRQSAGAVMAAQTAMANRRDQTDLLSQIRVPTLIVVGEQDIVTPPAVAQGMRDRIAGSQLVEIANAGHMTPLEAPEAVNAAIRDFAASVAG